MSDAHPITVQIPVLWGDLDSFGHVNNARYFTWLEAARMAYFDAVGVPTAGPGMTIGPILATTTCDFRAPVMYPDTVAVSVGVPKVGNTSFSMAYTVTSARAGLAAQATAVIVMVDYRTDQKIRVPDEIRARIAEVQGSI